MKKFILKYLAIAILGFVLFKNANELANATRVVDGVGGEGLFLILPLLWWIVEETFKDFAIVCKKMWRETKAEILMERRSNHKEDVR